MTAAAVTCAACATRVAETRPTSFTTIAPDTRLKDLQAEEALALCLDVNIFYETGVSDEDAVGAACATAGRWAAEHPESEHDCATNFTLCRDDLRARVAQLRAIDLAKCDSFVLAAGTCTATVGELDACLMESAGRVHQVASMASQGTSFCTTPKVSVQSVCPTGGTCRVLAEDIQRRFDSSRFF